MKTDVVVLGAGIVGLSTAIHLARRGKSVVLLDRRGAGEETSFGNAGLIQREGVFPYGFPHNFGSLFRYALNNTIDAHYHFRALPGLVPFLARYWWHSGFTQHHHIATMYADRNLDCRAQRPDRGFRRRRPHPQGWLDEGLPL